MYPVRAIHFSIDPTVVRPSVSICHRGGMTAPLLNYRSYSNPDRQDYAGDPAPLQAPLDGKSSLVVEHLVVELLQAEGELTGKDG